MRRYIKSLFILFVILKCIYIHIIRYFKVHLYSKIPCNRSYIVQHIGSVFISFLVYVKHLYLSNILEFALHCPIYWI